MQLFVEAGHPCFAMSLRGTAATPQTPGVGSVQLNEHVSDLVRPNLWQAQADPTTCWHAADSDIDMRCLRLTFARMLSVAPVLQFSSATGAWAVRPFSSNVLHPSLLPPIFFLFH
jgi:hypothetical protein